jgi:hypothetical protein
LASKTGVSPQEVLKTVVTLRQRGWVDMTDSSGDTPVYSATGGP